MSDRSPASKSITLECGLESPVDVTASDKATCLCMAKRADFFHAFTTRTIHGRLKHGDSRDALNCSRTRFRTNQCGKSSVVYGLLQGTGHPGEPDSLLWIRLERENPRGGLPAPLHAGKHRGAYSICGPLTCHPQSLRGQSHSRNSIPKTNS